MVPLRCGTTVACETQYKNWYLDDVHDHALGIYEKCVISYMRCAHVKGIISASIWSKVRSMCSIVHWTVWVNLLSSDILSQVWEKVGNSVLAHLLILIDETLRNLDIFCRSSHSFVKQILTPNITCQFKIFQYGYNCQPVW